jgi:hypothetical protein
MAERESSVENATGARIKKESKKDKKSGLGKAIFITLRWLRSYCESLDEPYDERRSREQIKTQVETSSWVSVVSHNHVYVECQMD